MLKAINATFDKVSRDFSLSKILPGIALAYTLSVMPAYSQSIVIDGKTNTALLNNGNTTNITTTTIKGSNAFNSFSKFNVDSGKTVNLVVPSSSRNLINLVHDEATNINGVLNSIQNGTVGGKIFLVNPNGIMVGSQGVINVGSLTAITPTKDFTDNFFDAPGIVNETSVDALLSGNAPVNPDALINVEGRINAISNVKLDTGSFTSSGQIQSGSVFKVNSIESGDIVNLNNLEDGTSVSNVAGEITIKADYVGLNSSSVISAKGINSTGGDINISGSFTSLGGIVDVSGTTGGNVNVEAQTLSLAEIIKAQGSTGSGGTVSFDISGKTIETASSNIDVSGTTGGKISHIAGHQITTSGNYSALGNSGDGGTIHISAPVLKFLSTQIDASGETGGGEILLGGEYQGGKNLETDIIPNAETLIMTSGTDIKANTNGTSGDGGTIITWADSKTIVLGNFEAIPGTESGDGGFVEVSSGDSATFGGMVQTGYGDRLGNFLLDPKNITIADEDYAEYNLIMGYDYQNGTIDQTLVKDDYFGYSVSMEGTMMAVGVRGDAGFADQRDNAGAVYLYTFDDLNYNGGTLQGIVGYGYTGGKNIDQPLPNTYYYASGVSLDNNRLAVGASGENSSGLFYTGAVYLYSFTDSTFSGGVLESKMGYNSTGGKNVNVSLDAYDSFGQSVSLDGTRIAVGVIGEDGVGNPHLQCGAIYLFTFTDEAFNGGTLQGVIGDGYVGAKDYNINLDDRDYLGSAVSLDGNSLVVGAYEDDGYNNSKYNSGAVYMLTFSDSQFSNPTLQGIIGSGYTTNKSINENLDTGDGSGWSLSLENNNLAVGVIYDKASGGTQSGYGSVYLYQFTDTQFTGGTLQGIMGSGYTGGKNVDVTLDVYDHFGSSVCLDSDRLVVGARDDDGYQNKVSNSGALYLFNFEDTNFTGGALQGIIGSGYLGGKNINVDLQADEYFGSSVSLDGTMLAVGATGNDGFSNTENDSGAVYLYTFSDENFNGGRLEGIIGEGYTGGVNYNINLTDSNYFGSSVSLDANRLAIGAKGDNGSSGSLAASGAVYLFTFSDSSFSGGTLQGIIGNGYSGSKDINITLESGDSFGSSVSLDGTNLVVGAPYDDGYNNSQTISGATYLFGFGDTSFSSGTLEGIIGYGYVGGKNVDLNIDSVNLFGSSVSLDGSRLAVGSIGDSGEAGTSAYSGAIRLFTFDDNNFTGGTLQGILGNGYTGGKNIDVSLENNDYFGSAVSLDSNRLIVGAFGDSGSDDSLSSAGAVYIFGFNDTSYNGGLLESIMGYGYTGGNNVSVDLESGDGFGVSTSFGSNHLIIGASGDDGKNNARSDSGAVYAYNLSESLAVLDSYAYQSSTDYTISASSLASMLSMPQNVTLKANNDITISNNITVDNASGDGGKLTLQAGRSIYINANITTDNADVVFIANDLLANGVVDSERDAGDAEIVMDSMSSATINAGSGKVTMELRSGEGKTNSSSGDITLNAITAGTILVLNEGETAGSDVLMSDFVNLQATDSGNSLVMSSANGSFINNSFMGMISTSGRWLIYSDNPTNTVKGTLSGGKVYNRTYANNAPDTITQTGNLFLYSKEATLTITTEDKSRAYGSSNPAFTYTVTGYEDGDTSANAYSGTPTISTTATQTSNAGAYSIAGTLGSLESDYGYNFNFDNGDLTINKVNLTVNVDNDSRTYGAAEPEFTASYSGFVLGQDKSVLGGSITTTANQNSDVGTYAITGSTLTSNNYNIISNNGILTVNEANLTVTADDKSKTYGDANPTLTESYSGFVLNQDKSVLGGTLNLSTVADQNSNAGTYSIVGSGYTSNNYNISYVDGDLTINKANLAVTADDKSKTYGDANPTLTESYSGFVLNQDKSVLGGTLDLSTAADQNSDAGAYSIVASGYTSNNYNISYINGDLTINKANLTVTADDKSKTYGDANPTLTESYSGFVLNQDKSVLGGALDLSTAADQNSDAGAYSIVASGYTSNNYNISYVDGDLTINKAFLMIITDNKTKTYGSANPTLTAEYNGFVLGQDKSVLSGSITTNATQSSDVGVYDITASGYTNPNYNIGTIDSTLTVNKVDLTITTNNKTKTYGSINPEFTASYSGFVLNQDKSVLGGTLDLSTTADQNSDTGTYSIVASGYTSNNYNISYIDGDLTINKAILTVTADDKSKTYGDANPTLTESYSGFVLNQDKSVLGGTLDLSTTAEQNSDSGIYSIVASGYTSGNYNINYVDGTLTVNKANLTVNVDDKSKTYGDVNPPLTANYSGFVLGQNESVLGGSLTTDATQSSNVGIYAITGSTLSSKNYNIISNDGTLTINKAILTVTADDKSKAYGNVNPPLTASYSGFVLGQNKSVLGGSLNLATAADKNSSVGYYDITASGYSSKNYDIIYNDGTLTITPPLNTFVEDAQQDINVVNTNFGELGSGQQGSQGASGSGGSTNTGMGLGLGNQPSDQNSGNRSPGTTQPPVTTGPQFGSQGTPGNGEPGDGGQGQQGSVNTGSLEGNSGDLSMFDLGSSDDSLVIGNRNYIRLINDTIKNNESLANNPELCAKCIKESVDKFNKLYSETSGEGITPDMVIELTRETINQLSE